MTQEPGHLSRHGSNASLRAEHNDGPSRKTTIPFDPESSTLINTSRQGPLTAPGPSYPMQPLHDPHTGSWVEEAPYSFQAVGEMPMSTGMSHDPQTAGTLSSMDSSFSPYSAAQRSPYSHLSTPRPTSGGWSQDFVNQQGMAPVVEGQWEDAYHNSQEQLNAEIAELERMCVLTALRCIVEVI